MASLVALGRVAERIETRSKDLHFRTVALTLIAVVPFTIAFLLCFAWKAVWTVISWLYAAGLEGWEQAQTLQRGGS